MPRREGEDVQHIDRTLAETEDLLRQQRDKALAFVAIMDATLENLARLRTGTQVSTERPSTGPKRYAGLEINEAISKFLENTGVPQSRQILKKELRDGGALDYKEDANVDRSLKYFLKPEHLKKEEYPSHGSEAVKPIFKEIEGKVGLSEWPEEKWKQGQ